MNAIAHWFRLDLRRRWRSLVVLALLIALASTTVMTAIAGARRTDSVADRLLAVTLPPTAVVLPNEPGFDWERVRALPEVEALATFVLGAYDIEDLPPGRREAVYSFPWAGDEIMRTIERPVVLEGRLADPARADEVMITSRFVRSFGKGVGDTVTLRLPTPEQTDGYLGEGIDPGTFAGPAVEATIVGIVRSGWFSEESRDDPGVVIPSPGLYAQYGPNLIGNVPAGYINALVRLHGGESAIPAFTERLEEVSGRSDIDVWNWADEVRQYRSISSFEAGSLILFAIAAAIAAVFLIGQSIARYAGSAVSEMRVLRGLGMSPIQARVAAAAGPTVAGVAGVILGIGGALWASRWFPIGSAAAIEPAPGVDIDATVFAVGLLLVPLLVASGSVVAATAALHADRSPGRMPRSAAAATVLRAGAPVPVVVGTRFALERGRGSHAVPVRPALFGAVTGVLGVLAVFTFSHGVDDAVASPERFGQFHHLEVTLGFNGSAFGPVDDLVAIVADDPDVVAVADARTAVAQGGGATIAVFAADVIGDWPNAAVVSGRFPDGPGQIAIAPRTADATGFDVGDTFELVGPAGRQSVTVSGIAFVPDAAHNDYATGAWTSRQTYDAVFGTTGMQAYKQRLAFVSLAPGADPAVVAARIDGALGIDGFLEPARVPVERAQLEEIRILPVFLAGFLAIMALGAVGHALATAVRRRRHDVAVLRGLGMTKSQSRGVIVTQAAVLALVGLLFGVPLGIALGRTIWRYVADTTPVVYVPPVALLAMLLVVPVTLLASIVMAAWPGHRAASLRVGHVLRTE